MATERDALTAEMRSRILCAITDFGSMKPEDDEDWESWYCAAFDMLGERVRGILAAALASAPAAAPNGERSNVELRGLWYGAGGSFHGPNVETGTMPEEKLLPFLRSLIAAEPAQPAPQAGAAEAALRKVLDVTRRYLPPGGPSAWDAMAEIIAVVDPWPLGQLED